MRPNTVLIGIMVTAAAVFLGTLSAVWRAVRMPPAEAMRPEPPANYRETLLERLGVRRYLDQPTRMIVRHLERQPVKSALSVMGIAFAVGIVMIGRFSQDSITYVIDFHFGVAAREDMTVTFVQPTSHEALFSLHSLPGVLYAEPFRTVPVELRTGHRSFRTAIQGFTAEPRLHRALDADGESIRMPDEGIVLTDFLGRMLGVESGDLVEIQVLEGTRPQLWVPVAGLVHEYFGANGYMSLNGLNRLLGEGSAISGAYLAVDPAERDALFRALEDMPRIASVSRRELAIQNFEQTMGDVAGVLDLVITLLAGIIAFGVVYNSARIALAERAWELASMRVLGYSKGEVAYILLGELMLLTVLAILPGF
ncbi:ABC transporter permease [Alkalilimnicola ehrlichii]|uniref:ABC transporter permease n=1 Tax=Alkalilimnicola ehrlichii TaxID=351052 RepID=UPI00216157C6|nr:FtsX-like permease family protein [Alkalilimnicola ehrlichii]